MALNERSIEDYPRPMRWDDRQSTQDAEEIELARESSVAFPWMSPVQPDSGLAKALFILRNHHATLTGAANVLVLEQWSFLNYVLTGKYVQCETALARKWGFSKSKPWSQEFRKELLVVVNKCLPKDRQQEVLEWFENKMMPGEIRASGENISRMLPHIARSLGLPFPPRIVAAPFDTCAQVLGMGILSFPGAAAVSMGTSMGVAAIASPPQPDSIEHLPVPDTPVRGASMFFDGVASCGSAINHIASRFGFTEEDGSPAYRRLSEALYNTKAGAHGLTMLPHFSGGLRRGRYPAQARGITRGEHAAATPSDHVRALYEGLAFQVRKIVEGFDSDPHKYSTLLVSGGPTSNVPFMQLLADVTNREVVVSNYTDSSLLGCAICCAAESARIRDLTSASAALTNLEESVKPRSAESRVYDKLFKSYCEDYKGELSS